MRLLTLWLRNRFSIATATAVLVLAILPLLNQAPATHLTVDQFDARKMLWQDCAEVVVLGDSRTYLTIDPHLLGESLGYPESAVYNLGMSGQNFYRRYLDHARAALTSPETSSRRPTMLVGITAQTLFDPELDPHSQYAHLESFSPLELWLRSSCPWYAGTDPIWPGELSGVLRITSPPNRCLNHGRHYFPNGFCAATPTEYDTSVCLATYKGYSRAGLRVNEEATTTLMTYLESWVADGIAVYAFHPPSCAAMDRLEADSLGFDTTALAARVRQSGATWLECDRQTEIRSYDGSHIDVDSARVFTRRVARAIIESRIPRDNYTLAPHVTPQAGDSSTRE